MQCCMKETCCKKKPSVTAPITEKKSCCKQVTNTNRPNAHKEFANTHKENNAITAIQENV